MGNTSSGTVRVESGGRYTIVGNRVEVDVQGISFERDHYLMRNNYIRKKSGVPKWARYDWGYSGAQGIYSKPEWKTSEDGAVERNHPVSYSRNQTICLRLTLMVTDRGEGLPLEGTLVGRPVGSDDPAFQFRNDIVLDSAGPFRIVLEANGALPDWPASLEKRLRWTFERAGKQREIGRSGPHPVFVTFGPPIDDGRHEDGVTRARMERATQWVQDAGRYNREAGRHNGVELIQGLFSRFDDYVFGIRDLPKSKRKKINASPTLKSYMREVAWPSFQHRWKTGDETAWRQAQERGRAQGGAWPLAVLEEFGGECQAIVRLVRGILMQVGYDATIGVRYLTADARHPYGPIISEEPRRCGGPKEDTRYYTLVDDPVEVGKAYTRKQIRWNNYEAFLRYRYSENDQDYEAWYGGGVGLIGEPQTTPLTDMFLLQLIGTSFAGLAEFEVEYHGFTTKRRITDYWSYSSYGESAPGQS